MDVHTCLWMSVYIYLSMDGCFSLYVYVSTYNVNPLLFPTKTLSRYKDLYAKIGRFRPAYDNLVNDKINSDDFHASAEVCYTANTISISTSTSKV